MATSEPLRAVQRDTPREAAAKMVLCDWDGKWWTGNTATEPHVLSVCEVPIVRVPSGREAWELRNELIAALAAWIEEDRRTR